MKKEYIILIISFLCFINISEGQRVRGGVLSYEGLWWPQLDVDIIIFTEGRVEDEVIVDWGLGGAKDTLRNGIGGVTVYDPDIYRTRFWWSKGYPSIADTFVVKVYASNLIDSVKNIPNSGNQQFTLIDTIHMNIENEGLRFLSTQTPQLNGNKLEVAIGSGAWGPRIMSVVPYPAQGATLPIDTPECCIVWEYPNEVGTYGFGVQVRHWSSLGTYSGTSTQAVMVDIDSSMFTSTIPILAYPLDVSLYPNPTSDVVHLSLPIVPKSPYTLRIYDFKGQVLQTIRGVDTALDIDLSQYPTGIYLLQMNDGEYVWSRKVVKR